MNANNWCLTQNPSTSNKYQSCLWFPCHLQRRSAQVSYEGHNSSFASRQVPRFSPFYSWRDLVVGTSLRVKSSFKSQQHYWCHRGGPHGIAISPSACFLGLGRSILHWILVQPAEGVGTTCFVQLKVWSVASFQCLLKSFRQLGKRNGVQIAYAGRWAFVSQLFFGQMDLAALLCPCPVGDN